MLRLTAVALIALAQDYTPGKIDWVRDPKIGLQRAQLQGRAALLYFTASW